MSRFAVKRAAMSSTVMGSAVMSSAVMSRAATTALLVALLAAPALAEDAAVEQYQTVGDYRWALYTACSLVFLCITVFLVMTHKTGAKLGEDVEHLERRIDDLEK